MMKNYMIHTFTGSNYSVIPISFITHHKGNKEGVLSAEDQFHLKSSDTSFSLFCCLFSSVFCFLLYFIFNSSPSFLSRYNEQRNSYFSEYFFCNASHKDIFQPFLAMRTHDYAIGFYLIRCL